MADLGLLGVEPRGLATQGLFEVLHLVGREALARLLGLNSRPVLALRRVRDLREAVGLAGEFDGEGGALCRVVLCFHVFPSLEDCRNGKRFKMGTIDLNRRNCKIFINYNY